MYCVMVFSSWYWGDGAHLVVSAGATSGDDPDTTTHQRFLAGENPFAFCRAAQGEWRHERSREVSSTSAGRRSRPGPRSVVRRSTSSPSTGPVAGRTPRPRRRPGLRHPAPRRESTRRSTRSPARTSTRGRRARPRDPRRPVRREPHHRGHRRQRGRGRRALADRDRGARGRVDPDPLQRLQELDGAAAATTARAWVKRFTATDRPGPYLRVVQEGDRCRRRRSRWCTGPGTASP